MEAVFNFPVAADQRAYEFRFPFCRRGRGDDVDGLGRPFPCPEGPGLAGDLGGLCSVRELDSGIDADAFDGPLDLAAIGALTGLVPGTYLLPWQGEQLVMEFGLVRFDREHVPGSAGVKVVSMSALGMQRIGRHDNIFQVLDTVQKRLEVGDLVVLLRHVLLDEYGAGGVVNASEQVDPGVAAVLG